MFFGNFQYDPIANRTPTSKTQYIRSAAINTDMSPTTKYLYHYNRAFPENPNSQPMPNNFTPTNDQNITYLNTANTPKYDKYDDNKYYTNNRVVTKSYSTSKYNVSGHTFTHNVNNNVTNNVSNVNNNVNNVSNVSNMSNISSLQVSPNIVKKQWQQQANNNINTNKDRQKNQKSQNNSFHNSTASIIKQNTIKNNNSITNLPQLQNIHKKSDTVNQYTPKLYPKPSLNIINTPKSTENSYILVNQTQKHKHLVDKIQLKDQLEKIKQKYSKLQYQHYILKSKYEIQAKRKYQQINNNNNNYNNNNYSDDQLLLYGTKYTDTQSNSQSQSQKSNNYQEVVEKLQQQLRNQMKQMLTLQQENCIMKKTSSIKEKQNDNNKYVQEEYIKICKLYEESRQQTVELQKTVDKVEKERDGVKQECQALREQISKLTLGTTNTAPLCFNSHKNKLGFNKKNSKQYRTNTEQSSSNASANNSNNNNNNINNNNNNSNNSNSKQTQKSQQLEDAMDTNAFYSYQNNLSNLSINKKNKQIITKLQNTIAQLQTDREQLRQKVDKLINDNVGLQVINARNVDKSDELYAKNIQKDLELQAIKDQYRRLSAQKPDTQKLKDQVTVIQRQSIHIEQLTKQLQQLQSDIKKQKQQYQIKYNNLYDENKQLKARITNIQNIDNKQYKQYKQYQERIVILQAKLAQKYHGDVQYYEGYKQMYEDQHGQYLRLQEQYQQMQINCGKIQQKYNSLQTEYKKHQQKQNNLLDKYSALLQQYRDSQNISTKALKQQQNQHQIKLKQQQNQHQIKLKQQLQLQLNKQKQTTNYYKDRQQKICEQLKIQQQKLRKEKQKIFVMKEQLDKQYQYSRKQKQIMGKVMAELQGQKQKNQGYRLQQLRWKQSVESMQRQRQKMGRQMQKMQKMERQKMERQKQKMQKQLQESRLKIVQYEKKMGEYQDKNKQMESRMERQLKIGKEKVEQQLRVQIEKLTIDVRQKQKIHKDRVEMLERQIKAQKQKMQKSQKSNSIIIQKYQQLAQKDQQKINNLHSQLQIKQTAIKQLQTTIDNLQNSQNSQNSQKTTESKQYLELQTLLNKRQKQNKEEQQNLNRQIIQKGLQIIEKQKQCNQLKNQIKILRDAILMLEEQNQYCMGAIAVKEEENRALMAVMQDNKGQRQKVQRQKEQREREERQKQKIERQRLQRQKEEKQKEERQRLQRQKQQKQNKSIIYNNLQQSEVFTFTILPQIQSIPIQEHQQKLLQSQQIINQLHEAIKQKQIKQSETQQRYRQSLEQKQDKNSQIQRQLLLLSQQFNILKQQLNQKISAQQQAKKPRQKCLKIKKKQSTFSSTSLTQSKELLLSSKQEQQQNMVTSYERLEQLEAVISSSGNIEECNQKDVQQVQEGNQKYIQVNLNVLLYMCQLLDIQANQSHLINDILTELQHRADNTTMITNFYIQIVDMFGIITQPTINNNNNNYNQQHNNNNNNNNNNNSSKISIKQTTITLNQTTHQQLIKQIKTFQQNLVLMLQKTKDLELCNEDLLKQNHRLQKGVKKLEKECISLNDKFEIQGSIQDIVADCNQMIVRYQLGLLNHRVKNYDNDDNNDNDDDDNDNDDDDNDVDDDKNKSKSKQQQQHQQQQKQQNKQQQQYKEQQQQQQQLQQNITMVTK